MNSTSWRCRVVRIAARSPGRSITGPDDAFIDTPSSLAITCASVVLPSLAESGRAGDEHVIERLVPLSRRGDGHLEVLAHAILADVRIERPGTQARFVLRLIVCDASAEHARIGHVALGRHARASLPSACRRASSNDADGCAFRTSPTAFSTVGRG